MKTLNNTSDKSIIVVIDDSPMLVNFLRSFLRRTYKVVAYSSTSEALKDLSEGKISPDCILTDYYLGKDLTGLEFIQQLKNVDPIIPVLVLSGSVDMNQKIACLQNGAVDFVSKPFNPLELDARIKNALAFSPQLNYYQHAI